ncbi:hypothetical protein PR202_ga31168 [Eleusine coracana subsp. coracana]|uniref:Uncharacterized protein n=1 Tax=Eleusine coracana subsp. coracana TaxID=191504 RepID=A0AAV5DPG4_ELECO|nr:hypothetical protein PR202_ga31168 [Eleusine coracana subsp. coracana]
MQLNGSVDERSHWCSQLLRLELPPCPCRGGPASPSRNCCARGGVASPRPHTAVVPVSRSPSLAIRSRRRSRAKVPRLAPRISRQGCRVDLNRGGGGSGERGRCGVIDVWVRASGYDCGGKSPFR